MVMKNEPRSLAAVNVGATYRVLPADLENRVWKLPAQHGLPDEQRAGFVCGDFVVHRIGSDQFAYQFAS